MAARLAAAHALNLPFQSRGQAASLQSRVLARQKYFCLKDSNGNLSRYFIFTSNVKITDKIISDSEKIVTARLNDAKFFIEEDLQYAFIDRHQKLRKFIFQEKLGSYYHKIKRRNI